MNKKYKNNAHWTQFELATPVSAWCMTVHTFMQPL